MRVYFLASLNSQILQCRVGGSITVGLDRYIGWPIYLADTDTDTDTDISVSANWISVSAISVSANLDICYIGIS